MALRGVYKMRIPITENWNIFVWKYPWRMGSFGMAWNFFGEINLTLTLGWWEFDLRGQCSWLKVTKRNG